MDMDIILGPHELSPWANIDYQWTLHVFQSLYYLWQLFKETFHCDHDSITEYKMIVTINFTRYIVNDKLSIQSVWGKDESLVSPTSLAHPSY